MNMNQALISDDAVRSCDSLGGVLPLPVRETQLDDVLQVTKP